MTYVYAFLAASAFGAGDFLGGLAARRWHWTRVVFTAQFSGLVIVLIGAMLAGSADLTWTDVIWSAVAGLGFVTGVCLLYKGLAEGTMAVVAPITALCAIALPVLFGLMMSEPIGTVAGIGIVVAIPAIILISGGVSDTVRTTYLRPSRQSVLMALAAGVGFAVFYISMKSVEEQGSLWPVAVARAVCFVISGLSIVLRPRLDIDSGKRVDINLAGAAGVFDGCATAFFFAASRTGTLSGTATIASLYPAVTILLAVLILRERITRFQKLGLYLAAVAIAAIAQRQ